MKRVFFCGTKKMSEEKHGAVVVIDEEGEELSRMREYNAQEEEDEEEERIIYKEEKKPSRKTQRRWQREDPDVEEEYRPRRTLKQRRPLSASLGTRSKIPLKGRPPIIDISYEQDDDEEEEEEKSDENLGQRFDENAAMRFLQQNAASEEEVEAYRAGQIVRADASRKSCGRFCTIVLTVAFFCTIGLVTMGYLGLGRDILANNKHVDPVLNFVMARVNDVRYSKLASRVFCKPCSTVQSPTEEASDIPREFVCDHAVGEHVLWTRGTYLNVTRASVDLHTSTTYKHGEGYVVPPVSEGELRAGMVGQVSLHRIASMLVGTWLRPTMVALKDKTVLCMHEVNHGLPQGDRRICVVRRHLGNNFLVMINPQLMGWSLEDASTIVPEYSLGCTGGQRHRVRRDVIEMTYTTLQGVRMRAAFSDGTEAHQLQRVCEEMRGAYVCDPPEQESQDQPPPRAGRQLE
jgi:hypothetical protein